MKKRGQGWGFDVIVASVVFLATLLIFFVYALNYSSEADDSLDSLFYNADLISSSLLSEGFPNDWNESNVVTIGIISESKVNNTKLTKLYNMTIDDEGYENTKSILNTRYDFFFNFSTSINIDNVSAEGIGRLPEGEPKNLISTSRMTVYDNKPSTFKLVVWE